MAADITAGAADTATATAARSAPGTSARYLHQIDLFRIITFACVIAVHVASTVESGPNIPSNTLQMLLHFTREAFFALTGFVLVYQYSRREFRVTSFWKRRFLLVGVPYVVWSFFYWGLGSILNRSLMDTPFIALRNLAVQLVEGTAWYHLYFLLVTMQVYLLFPLLLALLKVTRGHHKWLVMLSVALQFGIIYYVSHPPFDGAFAGLVWRHIFATVVPYQLYTVLGAVFAMHYSAVHAWFRSHARAFLVLVPLVVAGMELMYAHLVHTGTPPKVASSVFEIFAIPWFLTIIAGLYAFSSVWSARRLDHHSTARVVSYGSDRSFGIFLAHPFVLLLLLAPTAGPLKSTIGSIGATAVIYLGTVIGSVAIAEILRWVPGSLAFTGRPRLRRRSRPASP